MTHEQEKLLEAFNRYACGVMPIELIAQIEKVILESKTLKAITPGEKVIPEIERCIAGGDCDLCDKYHCHDCEKELLREALALLKTQNEVIAELRQVGYPHDFQNEKPYIQDYMRLITKVIRKAVKNDL